MLVSKSFMQHLPSLLEADCFHELWQRFLSCLQVLLGPKMYTPGHIVDGAKAGLGAVLNEMHKEGAFTPGEDTIGKELWDLTYAMVDTYQSCPGLMQEVFPGSGEPTSPLPPIPRSPQQSLDQETLPGEVWREREGERKVEGLNQGQAGS
ncbi:unnamed protein product [Choristocarpus tenellus]